MQITKFNSYFLPYSDGSLFIIKFLSLKNVNKNLKVNQDLLNLDWWVNKKFFFNLDTL